MKLSFKDFLTESDKFMEIETTYLKAEEEKDKKGKKKNKVKLFDPKKWREYLQIVKSIQ